MPGIVSVSSATDSLLHALSAWMPRTDAGGGDSELRYSGDWKAQYFDHDGAKEMGLAATKAFREGDVVVHVPNELLISSTRTHGVDGPDRFQYLAEDERLAFQVASMRHVRPKSKSDYGATYVNALPSLDEYRDRGFPLLATERDMSRIEDLPNVGKIAEWVRNLKAQLVGDVVWYNEHRRKGDPPLKFEDALWGTVVVMERSIDCPDQTTMVPVADLMQSSKVAQVYPNSHWVCLHDGVALEANRDIRQGNELLTMHVPPENDDDSVTDPVSYFEHYGITDGMSAVRWDVSDCTELKAAGLTNYGSPFLRKVHELAAEHCHWKTEPIAEPPTTIVGQSAPGATRSGGSAAEAAAHAVGADKTHIEAAGPETQGQAQLSGALARAQREQTTSSSKAGTEITGVPTQTLQDQTGVVKVSSKVKGASAPSLPSETDPTDKGAGDATHALSSDAVSVDRHGPRLDTDSPGDAGPGAAGARARRPSQEAPAEAVPGTEGRHANTTSAGRTSVDAAGVKAARVHIHRLPAEAPNHKVPSEKAGAAVVGSAESGETKGQASPLIAKIRDADQGASGTPANTSSLGSASPVKAGSGGTGTFMRELVAEAQAAAAEVPAPVQLVTRTAGQAGSDNAALADNSFPARSLTKPVATQASPDRASALHSRTSSASEEKGFPARVRELHDIIPLSTASGSDTSGVSASVVPSKISRTDKRLPETLAPPVFSDGPPSGSVAKGSSGALAPKSDGRGIAVPRAPSSTLGAWRHQEAPHPSAACLPMAAPPPRRERAAATLSLFL